LSRGATLAGETFGDAALGALPEAVVLGLVGAIAGASKTAKALGLTVRTPLLDRADEVIE
jgi:hypothetical protein